MKTKSALSTKIKGGGPIYGNVRLSGDPFASIFLIANSLLFNGVTIIENVPRCGVLLKFINVLDGLNIKVKWESESTVSVDGTQVMSSNLVNLFDGYDRSFAQILVPVLLFRKGECDVHPNLREEVKFFRGLGVSVRSTYNILNLKLPLNINRMIVKHLSLLNSDPFMVASRLLLKKVFPKILVDYNEEDKKFDFADIADETAGDVRRFFVSYNQYEFNLYASLAVFSNGDVILENFDLSKSLEFLLSLYKLGTEYEVIGNKLKIWQQPRIVQDMCDWTAHPLNAIGYLLFILSHVADKTVRVVCKTFPTLEHLITDLNIIGCRIEKNENKNHSLLTIKPSGPFSTVKTALTDFDSGGVLLIASVIFHGNSRISNLNILEEVIPYLFESLESLNIDISSS